MAKVYPGVFNGSEKLNAIELTKRMAWGYGGVAESLGITINRDESAGGDRLDYESLIRFSNLSSIAAAKFAHNNPQLIRKYWINVRIKIKNAVDSKGNKLFKFEQIKKFRHRTRRPFKVPKTDRQLPQTDVQLAQTDATIVKQKKSKRRQDYNGVMFSSKWLAEDMSLEGEQLENLR